MAVHNFQSRFYVHHRGLRNHTVPANLKNRWWNFGLLPKGLEILGGRIWQKASIFHILLSFYCFLARRPCRVLKLNITAKFHFSGNLGDDQGPRVIVGYSGIRDAFYLCAGKVFARKCSIALSMIFSFFPTPRHSRGPRVPGGFLSEDFFSSRMMSLCIQRAVFPSFQSGHRRYFTMPIYH